MSDEISFDDLQAVADAAESPTTEWAMARGSLTRAEKAQWTYKVGTYAVESGKSQRGIAEHFGMSQTRVHYFLKDFWQFYTLPLAEEHRKHEINIVDKVLDAWMVSAIAGDKDAAAVVAKFLDRRAKLTGSDAPVKVDATVVEVTAAERELQELLEQEARDQQVRESTMEEQQL